MRTRHSAQQNTRPRRRLGAILGALLVATTLSACAAGGPGGGGEASGGTSSGWPRTIQTSDGKLTLKKQPKVIVSTSTTLTGSALAVGAPVVASASTSANIDGLSDDQGFFTQWSKEAKAAKVKKLYENASPNIENAVEYAPDLILVSKNSGDSQMDSVAQLRKIAPVLVIDYSGEPWQEVTRTIAEATGREARAKQVIADYEQHLADVKQRIAVPQGTTSALMVFGDGSGAAALTKDSPHVQILQELGFRMAEIPESVKGNTSMGADRKDIVNLSMENIQKGLTGDNWLVVSADKLARESIATNPAFSTAPAVVAGKVQYTPGETFRLDYYSAGVMLDSLAKSYAK